MGKRGPQPKPTNVRRLEGNPGKRPLNDQEPEFSADGVDPPVWLTGDALAEWERTAPELVRAGVLTVVDVPLFAAYCQACEDYVYYLRRSKELAGLAGEMGFQDRGSNPSMATRGLMNNGKQVYKSPIETLRREAFEAMVKAGSRFGLSASDRTAIKVDVPVQEDELSVYRKKKGAVGQ